MSKKAKISLFLLGTVLFLIVISGYRIHSRSNPDREDGISNKNDILVTETNGSLQQVVIQSPSAEYILIDEKRVFIPYVETEVGKTNLAESCTFDARSKISIKNEVTIDYNSAAILKGMELYELVLKKEDMINIRIASSEFTEEAQIEIGLCDENFENRYVIYNGNCLSGDWTSKVPDDMSGNIYIWNKSAKNFCVSSIEFFFSQIF